MREYVREKKCVRVCESLKHKRQNLKASRSTVLELACFGSHPSMLGILHTLTVTGTHTLALARTHAHMHPHCCDGFSTSTCCAGASFAGLLPSSDVAAHIVALRPQVLLPGSSGSSGSNGSNGSNGSFMRKEKSSKLLS